MAVCYYSKLQYPVEQSTAIEKEYSEEFLDFNSTIEALDNLSSEVINPANEDGETFLLTHRSGGQLIVGIGPHGWLLMLKHPQYEGFSLQMIYGPTEHTGEVVFNLPDYTEFSSTVLHEEANAKKAIKFWLDTGEIPVFYLPNRDLGDGVTT